MGGGLDCCFFCFEPALERRELSLMWMCKRLNVRRNQGSPDKVNGCVECSRAYVKFEEIAEWLELAEMELNYYLDYIERRMEGSKVVKLEENENILLREEIIKKCSVIKSKLMPRVRVTRLKEPIKPVFTPLSRSPSPLVSLNAIDKFEVKVEQEPSSPFDLQEDISEAEDDFDPLIDPLMSPQQEELSEMDEVPVDDISTSFIPAIASSSSGPAPKKRRKEQLKPFTYLDTLQLFKCNSCVSHFKTEADFNEHFAIVHLGLQLECDVCHKMVPQDQLFQHKINCCKQFGNEPQQTTSGLKGRRKWTSEPRAGNKLDASTPPDFFLQASGKTSSQKSKLFTMKDNIFKCNYCINNFPNKKAFNEHFQSVHSMFYVKCKLCKEMIIRSMILQHSSQCGSHNNPITGSPSKKSFKRSMTLSKTKMELGRRRELASLFLNLRRHIPKIQKFKGPCSKERILFEAREHIQRQKAEEGDLKKWKAKLKQRNEFLLEAYQSRTGVKPRILTPDKKVVITETSSGARVALILKPVGSPKAI